MKSLEPKMMAAEAEESIEKWSPVQISAMSVCKRVSSH